MTIGEANQALCLHAESIDSDARQHGIVIACDTGLRPMSSVVWRLVCALAMALRPACLRRLPVDARTCFAVRHLGASRNRHIG